MVREFDFLVLGGGVAGLTFALEASKNGRVAVLTKRSRSEGNTVYAQGGIAAVLSPEDSFEKHFEDTMIAGAGLNKREVVDITVREGPERLKDLVAFGADFNRRENGEFDLTREGGHSKRRIVHSGDITGREVQRALLAACDETGKIQFFEDSTAIDLILDPSAPRGQGRCLGVYVLRDDGSIDTFLGKVTVLATGGAGKVYLYTSNPDVATGDGVAMAYRAGAKIANMEFYQFHPTCLFHPDAKNFLISEALRGDISNTRPEPVRLIIEERVPVSEVKEVEVQVLTKECQPSPSTVTQDGVARIEVELAANATKTAKFTWELSAAAKVAGV